PSPASTRATCWPMPRFAPVMSAVLPMPKSTVDACYRRRVTDRRRQLRELYGIDFPDELFAFAEWHQSLTKTAAEAMSEVLGVTLHGAFDVLAGKFDGRALRYPALLHWRYQYDPPEMFTVMVGNVDGLHWGYWFDDPGRLPPVVASFYARDSVDLT